jgi:hypothetical protein
MRSDLTEVGYQVMRCLGYWVAIAMRKRSSALM